MAGKFKSIKNQRTWTRNGRPCGEQSPYWDYLVDHSKREEGQLLEPAAANPDVLPETETPDNEALAYIRAHWREIGFTKRQAQVVTLVAKGLSQKEVAARVGITQQRVSATLLAVQKKARRWYDKNVCG